MIPPAFLDDGAPGTWLDAIYHSPRLNITEHNTAVPSAAARRSDNAPVAPAPSNLSDHAGSDLPNALAAPAPVSVPFHASGVGDV